jgi:hypothetical protein
VIGMLTEREAELREAVGGDYRVVSSGMACGRKGASWRTFRVEGPERGAFVMLGSDGSFSFTLQEPDA